MTKVEIKAATTEDARVVAMSLRAPDEVEVHLLTGKPAVEAIEQSLEDSSVSFVGYIDDEPVAVLGLAHLSDDVGIPWMLGTPSLDKSARHWLKVADEWVEAMQGWYPVLTNIVHNKNTKSIRWLKRLGFEFTDTPVPGHPDFIQFVRYRNV
jgi:hypothetical protein